MNCCGECWDIPNSNQTCCCGAVEVNDYLDKLEELLQNLDPITIENLRDVKLIW